MAGMRAQTYDRKDCDYETHKLSELAPEEFVVHHNAGGAQCEAQTWARWYRILCTRWTVCESVFNMLSEKDRVVTGENMHAYTE